MTSPSPAARARRSRLALWGLLAALMAAVLGLTGWAVSAGDAGDGAGTAAPTTTSSSVVTTTAVPPTTQPAAADLPVPEGAPVDANAPTPEVVHGTLALPTIGVSQPLHEGVTLTAIDRGPSHWPGTAMPGQVGNVVVAGHRVTHSRPFHDLDRLRPGDPLVFTMTDGTVWTYEHTGTEIVAPDAMYIVDQHPDHTATLFACHPKGSAAQRIVAFFRLVR
jgi:sortase A